MSISTDPKLDYVTRRFLVSGKVQGVYFRHSTRLEAQRLRVGGSARNLPDGSVEVIAHGTTTAVDALKSWLGVGPPMAKVAAVEEVQVLAEAVSAAASSADFTVQ